jgi:hypothetical protein
MFWQTFWPTAVAGAVVTGPSVYFAFLLDRRAAQTKDRKRVTRGWGKVGESGGVIYDLRDWANALNDAVKAGAPVPFSSSVGSSASLYTMVQVGDVPESAVGDVLSLARHTERLQLVTDPHLGVRLPVHLDQDVIREASLVGRFAHALIEKSRTHQP